MSNYETNWLGIAVVIGWYVMVVLFCAAVLLAGPPLAAKLAFDALIVFFGIAIHWVVVNW